MADCEICGLNEAIGNCDFCKEAVCNDCSRLVDVHGTALLVCDEPSCLQAAAEVSE